MEDGKMTSIDRVATKDICANGVSRIQGLLRLMSAVELCGEAQDNGEQCMCIAFKEL
jgi:hypothetical protein